MTNEPRAMEEIHAIRAKVHEETKGLTPEQRAKHANEQAQKLIDQYGLDSHLKAEPPKRKIV